MEFYIVNSYYDTLKNHQDYRNNEKYLLLQNYTSIQWLTKYQDAGEFSIECVDTEDNKNIEVGYCVYRSDKKVFAIIEEVNFEDNKMVVRGHFDALDKIINTTSIEVTNVSDGIKKIFQNNQRGFLKYSLVSSEINKVINPMKIEYDDLRSSIINICKSTGLGYRMNDAYGVQLFEGKVLKNTVLSDEIGNIMSQKLYIDNIDAKNIAIVIGEDENEKEVVVKIENPNNSVNYKTYAEVHVDAKSIKKKYKDDKGIEKIYSASDYEELLKQKGISELLSCNPVEEFSCEINEIGNAYQYSIDYLEGDIIPVRSKKYNKNVTMQISQVKEIWESAYDNKKRVILTLETI